MDKVEKALRPKIVIGVTVKKTTGCGNMYIQLGYVNGKLFEIFATLGRAGGCAMCYSESLTRSITTGLRCGVEVKEYVDQLKGARCPTPHLFPKSEAVLSCPDAIGCVLQQYGSLTLEEIIQYAKGEHVDEEASNAAKHIQELKEERDKADL